MVAIIGKAAAQMDAHFDLLINHLNHKIEIDTEK
jgi:hypothetical protein